MDPNDVVGFDTEASGPVVIKPDKSTFLDVPKATLTGYSVADSQSSKYYPVDHEDLFPIPDEKTIKVHWDSLFGDTRRVIVCHNLPFDLAIIYNYYPDIQIRARLACTRTIGSMLQKSLGGNKGLRLKWLRQHYLGLPPRPNFDSVTKGRQMRSVPVEHMREYAALDASDCRELYLKWWPELCRYGGEPIWDTVEAGTLEVVEHMQRVGLPLDIEYLAKADVELTEGLRGMERAWYARWGHPIGSDDAVARCMVPAHWPPGRRTKTGKYSVDSDMMAKAATNAVTEAGCQAAKERIRYTKMAKMKDAFTSGLVQTAVQYNDRRLHPSWNQTGALTGRYTVSDPNVQQFPSNAEDWVPNIKAAIHAPDGYMILCGDYSQIELRLAAHLSDDPLWLQAYKGGVDVHQQTADAIGCTRQEAKVYNFRLLYGGTAWAIHKELEISIEEATERVESFWGAHSVLQQWLYDCWCYAQKRGVVYTILGRPVPIPHTKEVWAQMAASYMKLYGMSYAKAEKKVHAHLRNRSGNAPIQGSNADLTKASTLKLFRTWQEKGWIKAGERGIANIIANEHDSIVCEVHKSVAEEAAHDLKNIMESIHSLNVPLIADVHMGPTWAAAKGK